MSSANLMCLLVISSLLSLICHVSSAETTNTLKPGQMLRDWEQLVSAGRVFSLGFFNPNPTQVKIGPSGPRHLGVWFNRIPVYSVWVGNKENPVPDSSGALIIDSDGNLKITYQGGTPIVISAVKTTSGGNFTATLLDTGNLVIRQVYPDGLSGPVLWQSFDYPDNILLPGMKLGMNRVTGHNWSLTSWLSEKLPTPGAFKLGLDPSGTNQLLVWRRGEVYWSSGVWKNGSFPSDPYLTKRNDIYEYKIVENQKERYFTYSIKEKDILSRWDLDTLGFVTVFTLDDREQNTHWIFESTGPCTSYGKNSSAVCLTEKPTKCRKGTEMFVPKRGFVNTNEPTFDYDPDPKLGLSDCHAKCWKNCTCIAYQSVSNYDGTGCQFWSKGSTFIPDEQTDNFVYLLDYY